MPELDEPTTTPEAPAPQAPASLYPTPWARRLAGMLATCLSKPQPEVDAVKAYLRALQEEGANPQAVYEEVSQETPNPPPYDQVAPAASSEPTSTEPETQEPPAAAAAAEADNPPPPPARRRVERADSL